MTESDKVDRLLQVLEATGLGWVATQVREYIRTGRTTMRSESVLAVDMPIGHIGESEGVDQLPPKAALEAASQALLISTFDLSAMGAEAYEFFRARIDKFDGITFTTEPMDEAKPFRLAQPEASRNEHREKIKSALVRLVDTGTNHSGD